MLYFFFNQQLYTLRKLNQGDVADPRAPLGGNFRPTQPLNGRTFRTNIFLTDKVKTKDTLLICSLQYHKLTYIVSNLISP